MEGTIAAANVEIAATAADEQTAAASGVEIAAGVAGWEDAAGIADGEDAAAADGLEGTELESPAFMNPRARAASSALRRWRISRAAARLTERTGSVFSTSRPAARRRRGHLKTQLRHFYTNVPTIYLRNDRILPVSRHKSPTKLHDTLDDFVTAEFWPPQLTELP